MSCSVHVVATLEAEQANGGEWTAPVWCRFCSSQSEATSHLSKFKLRLKWLKLRLDSKSHNLSPHLWIPPALLFPELCTWKTPKKVTRVPFWLGPNLPQLSPVDVEEDRRLHWPQIVELLHLTRSRPHSGYFRWYQTDLNKFKTRTAVTVANLKWRGCKLLKWDH